MHICRREWCVCEDGRGEKEQRGKRSSRNFLADDLHPSRENRNGKAPRVLVLPPRFIPLLSDDWQCAARPRRLSCISTRNFPFFFIILFIFLANHSDPAAVCLPMQMQRVGASCFFRLGFANPRLVYVLQYRPPFHPRPFLSSLSSPTGVWILLVINENVRIPLYIRIYRTVAPTNYIARGV